MSRKYKFYNYQPGRIWNSYAANTPIDGTPPAVTNEPSSLRFELTDHLGTVRAVVTGEKENGQVAIV